MISKKKKKKMPKGCLMVIADPLDLGHGKKSVNNEKNNSAKRAELVKKCVLHFLSFPGINHLQ